MQAEVIYKGATRPAMKLGIPLVPLVLVLGAGFLLMLWGGLLVSGWIALGVLVGWVPALIGMRLITAQDDQRFWQAYLSAKLRWTHHNRRFWQSRSYAPTLYRGASDVYRR